MEDYVFIEKALFLLIASRLVNRIINPRVTNWSRNGSVADIFSDFHLAIFLTQRDFINRTYKYRA